MEHHQNSLLFYCYFSDPELFISVHIQWFIVLQLH